ncbi:MULTISPECIES: hypothetical protein [Mumia]|uniref:hypothetical protein n=1 Tax=Mumia TaxID=1546255 RepID=UPI00141DB3CA|nr:MULTISPECIES: hypothetical protein [unclassified Mumia]QMW65393.1 hypothetical protein H4N58_14445 [Mumia sp. ZJ1417]
MTESVASWSEIVGLMIVGRGPLPDFSGVVRVVSTDEDDDDEDDEDDGEETMVTVHRVFVSGERVRRESLDGVVWAIDGEDQWIWDDPDLPPVCDPHAVSAFVEDVLITREHVFEWDEDDERPIEPIRSATFLGRRAWDVRWRHSERRLVIDDDTGLVLHRSGEGNAIKVAEWLEISVGDALDDALFSWDGSVRRESDGVEGEGLHGSTGSRIDTLDALDKALSRWDEIAPLAAEVEDGDDLIHRLADLLDVDRTGARAVAEMQLRRVARVERRRIREALTDERNE